jgi:hypothetical protein
MGGVIDPKWAWSKFSHARITQSQNGLTKQNLIPPGLIEGTYLKLFQASLHIYASYGSIETRVKGSFINNL